MSLLEQKNPLPDEIARENARSHRWADNEDVPLFRFYRADGTGPWDPMSPSHVAALLKEAYEAGHKEGYVKGRRQGYRAGRSSFTRRI